MSTKSAIIAELRRMGYPVRANERKHVLFQLLERAEKELAEAADLVRERTPPNAAGQTYRPGWPTVHMREVRGFPGGTTPQLIEAGKEIVPYTRKGAIQGAARALYEGEQAAKAAEGARVAGLGKFGKALHGLGKGAKVVGRAVPGLMSAMLAYQGYDAFRKSGGATEEQEARREALGYMLGDRVHAKGEGHLMELEGQRVETAADFSEMIQNVAQHDSLSTELREVLGGSELMMSRLQEKPKRTLAETLAIRGLG